MVLYIWNCHHVIVTSWSRKNCDMDLCYGSSVSQFSDGIEDRVVVGSLDLNQCRWLPDEIAGTKPEGICLFDVANNAELKI